MDIQRQKFSNLPLSWQYSSNKSNPIEQKLITSSQVWLTTAKMDITAFDLLIQNIISSTGQNFLIRGCNKQLAKFLESKNFDKILFAKEAVLEVSKNHFEKKSIKELVKRGFKKGSMKEVVRSPKSIEKLKTLIKDSRHGHEPQLKNLFITGFNEETRLFVLESNNKEWLSGILVSLNTPTKYHTELLLRNRTAPIGVMEALIFGVYEKLKSDGAEEISLGEVPFIIDLPISKSFYRDFILNRIAKFFRFAYNYKGLYDFKNKFNPRWDDLYICGYSKLRLSHISGIIVRSNLLKLIFYKLFT